MGKDLAQPGNDPTRLTARLSSLLTKPAAKKDLTWAHACCKASRQVHIEVLYDPPEPAQARDVIDLLSRLSEDVERIPEAKLYARNIRFRIDSIMCYLRGESPPPFETQPERE